MSDDVPLILIDESCFTFSLRSKEQLRNNETLIAFIREAQASGLFSLAMIGHRPPAQLKRQLGSVFYKKPLNKIPVHTWKTTPIDHAEILISARARDNDFLADSAALHFTPDQAVRPNFLTRLIGQYDSKLKQSYERAGEAANLANAQIQLANAQIQKERDIIRMYQRFVDPNTVWEKIQKLPAVNNLVNTFSGAAESHGYSPQEIILAELRTYFEHSIVCQEKTTTLLHHRGLLKSDFRSCNVGYRYDHVHAMSFLPGENAASFEDDARQHKGTALVPLAPEHRVLLDNALRAIHHVVRTEPRHTPK